MQLPSDCITLPISFTESSKSVTVPSTSRFWSVFPVSVLPHLFSSALPALFGNMECETHDKQFIHDKTGLSAEAIEQLIKWNEKTKLPDNKFYRNSILFISNLLECCGIQAAALAQNVSNYLFYRKISETENLTSQITKGLYDKYEVGRTRASYKFLDCLEYIYKHSKNIPTKESLQTAYPKTEEEKYWDDILDI